MIWYTVFVFEDDKSVQEDKVMGLFSRKKKNPEKNEISNKELKENLANAALTTLKPDEDYQDLAYTTCEFGYLFVIEGHGLEALFKIITDKGTFYFAAQGNEILRLQFNEELFKTTTDKFLDLHQ